MGGIPDLCPIHLRIMKIALVTPAPPDSRYGNRITAVRWARILRRLGNRVSISQMYDGELYDLLVALHARKSHPSIVNFRRHNPSTPIVVTLTGTDLYAILGEIIGRKNHSTYPPELSCYSRKPSKSFVQVGEGRPESFISRSKTSGDRRAVQRKQSQAKQKLELTATLMYV